MSDLSDHKTELLYRPLVEEDIIEPNDEYCKPDGTWTADHHNWSGRHPIVYLWRRPIHGSLCGCRRHTIDIGEDPYEVHNKVVSSDPYSPEFGLSVDFATSLLKKG